MRVAPSTSASHRTPDISVPRTNRREWDGPAALPPPTALRVRRGACQEKERRHYRVPALRSLQGRVQYAHRAAANRAMAAAVGSGTAFVKGRDFGLGSVWCRSRCRQVIGRSLGASASAAIATCARCSCRAPELFCSERQTGQSIVLDRGSWLR
jgi:hypothetical protein